LGVAAPAFAQVLVGEPVSTPDQVGGRLSPEHAVAAHGVIIRRADAAVAAPPVADFSHESRQIRRSVIDKHVSVVSQ
jgi:hypothetical protein